MPRKSSKPQPAKTKATTRKPRRKPGTAPLPEIRPAQVQPGDPVFSDTYLTRAYATLAQLKTAVDREYNRLANQPRRTAARQDAITSMQLIHGAASHAQADIRTAAAPKPLPSIAEAILFAAPGDLLKQGELMESLNDSKDVDSAGADSITTYEFPDGSVIKLRTRLEFSGSRAAAMLEFGERLHVSELSDAADDEEP